MRLLIFLGLSSVGCEDGCDSGRFELATLTVIAGAGDAPFDPPVSVFSTLEEPQKSNDDFFGGVASRGGGGPAGGVLGAGTCGELGGGTCAAEVGDVVEALLLSRSSVSAAGGGLRLTNEFDENEPLKGSMVAGVSCGGGSGVACLGTCVGAAA